ncbi:hypothetical protein B0O80DRAFT_5587 [Mortierella sp. GBAus27b]|nr:hypothetical protein B0O80DRAFT_5587 [Mortierella sp. GBAus27b]
MKRPNGSPILLVMEPSVWTHHKRDPTATWRLKSFLKAVACALKNIILVMAPIEHMVSLPMTAGLVQEFRCRYYYQVMSTESTRTRTSILSNGIIREAWDNVQGSAATQRSFELLLTKVGSCTTWPAPSEILSPRKHNDAGIDIAKFDKVFPALARSVWGNIPDTMIQYYMTQDSHIGPSSLLRAKLQEMQHHEDYQGCFGPPEFGHPFIGALEQKVVDRADEFLKLLRWYW